MSEHTSIEERYEQFQMLELPGQPRGMHMGTAYLMGDLFRQRNELLAALESACASIEQLVKLNRIPENNKGLRDGRAAIAKATTIEKV